MEELIAARLRDVMLSTVRGMGQLREAVRSVVNLHSVSPLPDGNAVCAECGQDRTDDRPCTTVRALAAQLGVS